MNPIRPAIVMFVLLTLITGVAYPLVVTGLAQAFFSDEANGSLIERNGKPVASRLIGQGAAEPNYFWGRPSGTSPYGYNGTASGGSNQGPTSKALADAVAERLKVLHVSDPENRMPVPVDLVTASASGLDPHVSPAAIEFQISRVAKVREIDEAKIRALLPSHTEGRQWGILGEPRVNVLTLNLALDRETKKQR